MSAFAWITAIRAAAVANVALLVVLGVIWGRNYLSYRSKYAGALVTFVVLLLGENLLSLYMYLLDPTLVEAFGEYVPAAGLRAMFGLHLFETAALAVLLWSAWD